MAPLNPPWRVHAIHDTAPKRDAAYVLYWMIGARRSTWNFALDRAVSWADELGTPLLILEALRCDYQWASDRIHSFVVDGMKANAAAFADARISYYPYLEPAPGAGGGLVAALAAEAAVVVTDQTPVFDLAWLVESASKQIHVRFEEIDGYGIVPVAAPAAVFPTAYAFRRYLQRTLRDFLPIAPRPDRDRARDRRLAAPLSAAVEARWPRAELAGVESSAIVRALPIDHSVGNAPSRGGETEARATLETFISERLGLYAERSHPDAEVQSNLSPYLHFGHISPHEVLSAVLESERWSMSRLSQVTAGKREGWWGVSPPVEDFLDQLVTWRELGANTTRMQAYTSYDTLPGWSRASLDKHATDPRPALYTLAQFAQAETHDPLWNAAQRQLLSEGRLHNYLRMLWGKKILEWTTSPQEALATMIELNNRYALDGRDPNSYSGIFWVLGRYDRPWGPERPIFGTVRYMTSENAARKLRLKDYLRRYGASRLL